MRKDINESYRKKIFNRSIIAAVSLALIMLIGAMGIVAYLHSDAEVQNTMNPAKVDVEIIETFNDKIKENVKLKNTGNVPAYLRATIIVNWVKVDEQGNVTEISGDVPVSPRDYELEFAEDAGNYWTVKDPNEDNLVFYYKAPVEPGTETSVLIKSCEQNGYKDGYQLDVQILAEAVQSIPKNAVTNAWGFDPSAGN